MLILPPLAKREWRAPSQHSSVVTRFCIVARLDDGFVKWRGWFDDRDDADAFMYAIALNEPVHPSIARLPTPNWYEDLGQLPLTYEFNSVTLLTAIGANTWSIPADWSSVHNFIGMIGGGGAGSAGNGVAASGSGGGGGAYAENDNITLTPSGTLYYSGGTGGTTSGGNGADTWINYNSNTPPANTAQGALAKAGSGGASGGSGGGGGAAGSSIGNTTVAGGRGGDASAANLMGGGGGGAAAGPSGIGGNGGTANSSFFSGGGGGGGSNGQTNGSASGSGPSNGGNGGGTNGGGGGSGAGANGSLGGGGAGGAGLNGTAFAGGSGGANTTWVQTSDSTTYGPGGGGGGGGGGANSSNTGGNGGSAGLYGGGGGGAGAHGTATQGNGAQGIVVITYSTTSAKTISPLSASTVSLVVGGARPSHPTISSPNVLTESSVRFRGARPNILSGQLISLVLATGKIIVLTDAALAFIQKMSSKFTFFMTNAQRITLGQFFSKPISLFQRILVNIVTTITDLRKPIKIIPIDTAYGSSNVVRFYQNQIYNPVYVNDSASVVVSTSILFSEITPEGAPAMTNQNLIMLFTRPDGSFFVKVFPFAYIGEIDLPSPLGYYYGGSYAVTPFATNELNQSGVWGVELMFANFRSPLASFTILPPP